MKVNLIMLKHTFSMCGLGYIYSQKSREVIEVIWSRRESANGGCLGSKRRRRTWNPAKSFGELESGDDPKVSEWGNPA